MVNVELSVIKRHLERGDQKKIAKSLKLSNGFVNAVLNGKKKGLSVVDAALKLALKNKQKNTLIAETITEKISTL